MNILALDPNQVSANAATWIGVGVGIILGLTSAAAVVLPKIAALREQVAALFHSRDTHSTQIATNTAAIIDVAKALPPASAPTSPPNAPK